MSQDIKKQYGLEIQFKYVPTTENPADMLTRGLTREGFGCDLDKWLHGPKWLRDEHVVWPTNNLECLSPENKQIVQTNLASVQPPVEPVVPYERYSSLSKLIGVTASAIKFTHLARKG